MNKVPDRFVFMKVGQHAGEDFHQILTRKKKEYERTGMIFWGYGGNTLHPHNHVQPFVQTYRRQGNIYLLMQPIESHAVPEVVPATEYSVDLMDWKKIPDGVTVLGSKYALILGDIEEGDLDLNLNNYQVGVGKSIGKNAENYVRGHIDKGCFVKAETEQIRIGEPLLKKVKYYAKLKKPYAVSLR